MSEESDDLARIFGETITLDGTLQDEALRGERMSAAEARRAIEQQLASGLTDINATGVAPNIARAIVAYLPDEMMYDSVITKMDLRPFLDTALNSGWATTRSAARLDAVAGVTRLMEQQQETAKEIAVDTSVAMGATGDAEQNVGTTQQYDPTVVGFSPISRVAQVQEAAATGAIAPGTEGQAIFTGDITFAEEQSATFNEEDWRRTIGMPQSVFDQLIDAEIAFNEEMGTPGQMRTGIEMTAPVAPNSTGGGGRPIRNKVSIHGALGYLARLGTPEEVASMQEKMAAAGYFEKVGQDFAWGDPDDEATYNAWQLALLDSYTKNVPLDQLLVMQAADRRKLQQQQMMQTWGEVQAETARAAANQMAREALGRDLDDSEFQAVQTFLTGLQNQRADDLIGVDDTSWRNQQTMAQGYDENDIARGLDTTLAGEMSSSAGWDTAQKVWQAFDLGDIDTKYVAEWRAQNRPRWMDEEDA